MKTSQLIGYLAYQYKAYPILHYYHTRDDEHASAVRIAIFDEALTLLRFGVREESQPNEAIPRNAAASTDNYLATRSAAFIEPAAQPPPPPDLDHLRNTGIPTVSDQEFVATLNCVSDRRRQLLAMVEMDERDWPSYER